MFITVEGQEYRVNIWGPDPFALMGEWVIGLTPWAPRRLLSQIRAVWAKKRYEETATKDWSVIGKSGREHQVLLIGDKWLCDCWPFRKQGICQHIKTVQDEEML